jgi:hypothetical protein
MRRFLSDARNLVFNRQAGWASHDGEGSLKALQILLGEFIARVSRRSVCNLYGRA